MIVQFTYTEGTKLSVTKTVAAALDCNLTAAKMCVDQGFVEHLTPEMAKKLSDALSHNVYVKQVNTNNEDGEQKNVPACVEEVSQSEFMIASEIDEDTNESITVVLCLITPSTETVEKFKNNRKRMSGILPIVGSIVPQIRRIVMGTIVNDNKETLMVALASPSCAIALDKATQLGEFAEAIGETIIDFVDNDFNEARIRAIAADMAPLYNEED